MEPAHLSSSSECFSIRTHFEIKEDFREGFQDTLQSGYATVNRHIFKEDFHIPGYSHFRDNSSMIGYNTNQIAVKASSIDGIYPFNPAIFPLLLAATVLC